MFKFFCILIALSAVHAQQLPFRLSLDRNYVLSWGFDNQTMTFQLDVENKGWVALALVSDDGALLDVWWGGYDEEYDVPYMQDAFSFVTNLTPSSIYQDTINHLNLVNATQIPFGGTYLRFTRPFDTRDTRQDVAILNNARQLLIWSYSNSDMSSSPAVASGTVQLVLRPII